MKQKNIAIALALIMLLMPVFTFAMNKILFSRFNKMPLGLFEADLPLMSFMQLTKNFTGESFRYGFYLNFFGKRYSTNTMGFRVPEVTLSKDLIIFSGDSTIFGAGLNDEETVPYLTGKGFADKYDVVNTGIPGKAIPHNLLTLINFIEIANTNNIKIKYFINWIHGTDFNYERTLDDVRNRALKSNLTWKQELKARFPFLAEVWWAMRMHGGLGGPALTTTKTLFLERKKFNFKVSYTGPRQPYNEIYLKQNDEYFNWLQNLCAENNIVLLNVVHAPKYQDIVSHDGESEQIERILKKSNAEHIIKTKNIYWQKPEMLPYIAREDNDFAHFSKRGAKIVADHLISIIQIMEDNDLSRRKS